MPARAHQASPTRTDRIDRPPKQTARQQRPSTGWERSELSPTQAPGVAPTRSSATPGTWLPSNQGKRRAARAVCRAPARIAHHHGGRSNRPASWAARRQPGHAEWSLARPNSRLHQPPSHGPQEPKARSNQQPTDETGVHLEPPSTPLLTIQAGLRTASECPEPRAAANLRKSMARIAIEGAIAGGTPERIAQGLRKVEGAEYPALLLASDSPGATMGDSQGSMRPCCALREKGLRCGQARQYFRLRDASTCVAPRDRGQIRARSPELDFRRIPDAEYTTSRGAMERDRHQFETRQERPLQRHSLVPDAPSHEAERQLPPGDDRLQLRQFVAAVATAPPSTRRRYEASPIGRVFSAPAKSSVPGMTTGRRGQRRRCWPD